MGRIVSLITPTIYLISFNELFEGKEFWCEKIVPLSAMCDWEVSDEEAFAVGVVAWVGGPADARDDAVFAQGRHIIGMEVLHTPIRVMHQPCPRLSVLQSIRQSRQRKPRAQSPIERPPDHSSREPVQHHC